MPPPPSFSTIRYWPRISPIMAGFCRGILSAGGMQSQRIGLSNRRFGSRWRIQTKHSHKTCRITKLAQCRVQICRLVGLYVQEKLILPRAAVNRAALDLEQVDPVAGKGFQRGQKSSWFMGKPKRQRNFFRG